MWMLPGVAAATPSVPIERVVAVVNDAIVLNTELEARLAPVRAEVQQIADPSERRRRLAKLAGQVLDEMVNDELIIQAAHAAKLEVDSSDIQSALDMVKQQSQLDDAGLVRELAKQGDTLASFKQELRRQVLRHRAVNQLVGPKVQITDEDVHARYDELNRRSSAVSAVYLSHILFKLPEHPSEQQIAAARAEAAKTLDRVRAGEAFADVARQVSADPNIELGWFQRGSIDPAWEQIVFAMEKGDTRGPVEGPQGLRLFHVSDVKATALKPYAEMKDELQRELFRRELDKQTGAWVEELRKKAYIDIKLQ